MKSSSFFTIALIAILVCLSVSVSAMDKKQEMEFHRLSTMSLDDLTDHAKAALQKKYPGEKWQNYHFPDFVFANESVETAYRIAVKRPELLAKIHCYCPCGEAGHKNLLYCYFKDGKAGVLDKHASFCLTCYTEALLAFSWAELGATDQEIVDGIRKKYMPERPIPEGIMSP
ncbi:MAG: hypothetical protein HYS23_00400 [Geobacter sp.]|nr:hypothetical protein [Geobacter sp.]